MDSGGGPYSFAVLGPRGLGARRPLGGGAPAVPFAVAQEFVVDFHNENPDLLATVTWDIPAPTPGNSLIAWLKPTFGECVVLSFSDNLSNAWTHDHAGGDGHFFSLSQCPNSPTQLTITVNTLIGCRLYGVELTGCPAGVDFISGVNGSYTAQTGQTFSLTTADNDSFAAAVTHTSPSRTPVANAGSNLERLLVNSGAPYTGPVSEHSVYKLFPVAGSVSFGSSWVPEGACDGTFGRALYKKTV